MKAFITTHANTSEWESPSVLTRNIRYRHSIEKPDFTLNLFNKMKFIGIGGEHEYSFCGEMPTRLNDRISKHQEIVLTGLYKDRCLDRTFYQILHSVDRIPKEYTIKIPSNCVVNFSDKELSSSKFDKLGWYGDFRIGDKHEFFLPLIKHDVEKIVSLDKNPDVIYKLVPKI